MGWGTTFDAHLHISNKIFNSIAEIDDEIKVTEETVQNSIKNLQLLAVATPKDVTPPDEIPLFYVKNQVKEEFEMIEDSIFLLRKLYILRDIVGDDEEKLKSFADF